MSELKPGQVIGERYEVLSELGEGGFGTVYAVRQLGAGKRRALKVLRASRLSGSDTPRVELKRFRREALLVAELEHPHVVQLIDTGELDDGLLYMVLQYIEGENLRELLDREGALPPREALELMTQVLSAIVCAHESGIVHRDIKPENIMVRRSGGLRSACVLDFGIANIVEDARGLERGKLGSLVLTREVIGSPQYMSPEQLAGKLTPLIDLYAWGLVLLECLTGHPAVQEDTLPAIVYRHLAPDPIELPESLRGSPLASVVKRAVAKDPAERFPSATALLEAVLGLDPRTATRTTPERVELKPGMVLAERYELGEVIGEGGFGTIYAATQLGTGKRRALKVLNPAKLAGAATPRIERRRFEREMHLVARLEHPNIVQLIDTGTLLDGRLYMVLQLIEGETLRGLLDREGALPPRDALRLMTQVLSAIVCAHESGIVHRDIKPENIMVRRSGGLRSACVLDFGIANIVEAARGLDAGKLGTLAITDQIVGTPRYMAPEQLRGDLDPRTDLYAWGLVFVECLTGQPPIGAASLAELIARQMSPEPVPLPEEIGQHPIGQLISAATHKSINARPETAAALLEQLLLVDLSPSAVTGEQARAARSQELAAASAGEAPVEGWYVCLEGQPPYGPLEEPALKLLFEQEQLPEETLLREATGSEWRAAAEVEPFRGVFEELDAFDHLDPDEIEALTERIPDLTDPLAAALLELGVDTTHLSLITMLPLVRVAWADGIVQPAERKVIDAFALERGVQPKSPTEARLASLLLVRPDDALLDQGVTALRLYLDSLPDANAVHAKLTIFQRCIGVAEASHNRFNPFSERITAEEHNTLDLLEAALGLQDRRIPR